ncbi:MAG: hypothetical protein IT457_18525 [Planctomycetes bacterium]|nr:hypothetical protein [Planctomycetota bacterium]
MRSGTLVFLLLAACSSTGADPTGLRWTPLDAGIADSLRGLSVVSADCVWASGEDGTVLRSIDGGASFARLPVHGADELDLRSIHAFDADVAVVVSAGSPARVFHTQDGGQQWQLVHEDERPEIFLDGIAFADEANGWIVGDPIDGRFVLLATNDGGRSFQAIERAPHAERGEAAFAASGSAIACVDGGVRIATGGAVSRVIRSDDDGRSWQWARVPMLAGRPSRGVFSLAFADARVGVAVGGDYREPTDREGCAAYSVDGGRSWHRSEVPPMGYRSSVACATSLGQGIRVAVGPTGADLSLDGGRTWQPIGNPRAREGHHAIAFAPDAPVGYAVGSGGRITRLAIGR